jgi:O-antigen/teichoic acid export membrane protein
LSISGSVYVLALTSGVILAHLANPAGFGIFALGAAVASAGYHLVIWPLYIWLVQQGHAQNQGLIGSSIAFSAIALALIAASGSVLALALDVPLSFVCGGVLLLILLPLRLPASVKLLNSGRAGALAALESIGPIVYQVVAVVALALGAGIVSIGLALAAWALATSAWSLAIRRPPGLGPVTALWSHRVRLRSLWGLIFWDQARASLIPLFVAALASAAVLGIWTWAFYVVLVPSMIVSALGGATFIAFADIDRTTMATMINRAVRPCLALGVGIIGVCAGISQSLIAVALGPQWQEIAPTIWALAGAGIALAVLSLLQEIANARDRSHLGQAWSRDLGLALFLIDLPMLAMAGLVPFALCYTATALTVGVIAIHQSARAWNLRWTTVLRPMVGGALAAASGWLAGRLMPTHTWGAVVASLVAALGGWLLWLTISEKQHLWPEIQELSQRIRGQRAPSRTSESLDGATGR